MAPHYTLYASEGCCLIPKIEAAAKICGVELKVADAKHLKENAPFPRFPAMHTPEGLVCGSNAALRHFARAYPMKQLYGTYVHSSQVDSALDAVALELEMPVIAAKKGLVTKERAAEEVAPRLAQLDGYLNDHHHLVGTHVSIADIAFANVLRVIKEHNVLPLDGYKNFGKIQTSVEHATGGAKRAEAPKKKTAKPETAKPETAEPEPRRPESDSGSDAIPAPAADEYDMDAWKRKYSNSKDLRGDAMQYFWDKFDPAKVSLWSVKYKRYNDQDCVEAFKASNLLGCFYQRIDPKVRKQAFAVCNVLQRTGYYDIEGVLFVNGLELPKELVENAQFESFDWVRLDFPACKAQVEDFFCEDDVLAGATIADCKVYK